MDLVKEFEYETQYDNSKRQFFRKTIYNQQTRYMVEGTFIYLRKLDRLQQKATLGDFDAIPKDLQIEEEIKMPKYFKFDIRESLSEWFDNTLMTIIREVFDVRLANEKSFSRHQLHMLDLDINQYFSTQNTQLLLDQQLAHQMSTIILLQDVCDFYKKGGKISHIHQFTNKLKNQNKQL